MKKNLIIAIIVIISIILLPILVNFIIGLQPPYDLKITGESKDWISFYGNYSGSIISGLISFIILYMTILATQHEARINRKKLDFENLSKQLEEIISLVSFARIGNIALFYDNILMCENEILSLDKIRDDVIRKNNMMHLFYDNEVESNIFIKAYITQFDECANKFNSEISTMILLISGLNMISIDIVSARNVHKNKIKEQIGLLKTFALQQTKTLYQTSQSWLEYEKKELDKLQKKQFFTLLY